MDAGSSRKLGWKNGTTPQWLIVVLLTVIATALVVRPPAGSLAPAFAQTAPPAGARGVFAFPCELSNNRHGLIMMDVDEGTIWCYEIDSGGAAPKLRLIAARTWIYDRYLQDFNCAEPSFRTVQELVARQRGQLQRPEPLDPRPQGPDGVEDPDSD